MKKHSEQILVIGGSIFLVGLIIADVLIQRSTPTETPSAEVAQGKIMEPAPQLPAEPDTTDVDQDVNDENVPGDDMESLYTNKETTPSEPSGPPATAFGQAAMQPSYARSFPSGIENQSPPPVQKAQQEQPSEVSGERVAWYQTNTSNISPVQFNVFFNALRPHGYWFKHRDHGACWIPQVSQGDAQWRPYLSGGKWTYNDGAWLWVSNYRWGGYPFHYGRWFHTSKGWAWKPEGDWSAAWVSWRNSDAYCGWAPLPPTDEEVAASVASTLKHRVNTDDLTADHFVFLPKEHLLDPVPTHEVLGAEKARKVFDESTQSDQFFADKGRRWFNKGIPVQDVMSKIQMAESTPQQGTRHQAYQNPNQQGQSGGLNGNRQAMVDRTFAGQFRQGQIGRREASPILNPSAGTAPAQQGQAARQAPITTSNSRMENLIRAEQAPSVANYNRVNTLPVRQKITR